MVKQVVEPIEKIIEDFEAASRKLVLQLVGHPDGGEAVRDRIIDCGMRAVIAAERFTLINRAAECTTVAKMRGNGSAEFPGFDGYLDGKLIGWFRVNNLRAKGGRFNFITLYAVDGDSLYDHNAPLHTDKYPFEEDDCMELRCDTILFEIATEDLRLKDCPYCGSELEESL